MSRAIPSSLLSALIGDNIQPFFAVELMFDTRTDILGCIFNNKNNIIEKKFFGR